jgi:hypothetical protein
MPTSYPVEGTLRLGTSYLYAPGKTVDLSFGVGLTPDTPNLRFSVGFAFRRSLWNLKGGRCRNRLVGGQSSGWGVASHEERVEGNVLEETDLEADSDDLTKIGRCREVLATGAKVGQAEVAGTGEFKAGGDDGGVKIEHGAELDLEAELHRIGREGLAL